MVGPHAGQQDLSGLPSVFRAERQGKVFARFLNRFEQLEQGFFGFRWLKLELFEDLGVVEKTRHDRGHGQAKPDTET